MKREEIKDFITAWVKAYRKQARKRTLLESTTSYQKGNVAGMVKAFKHMGMLEKDDQMVSEIMDELF